MRLLLALAFTLSFTALLMLLAVLRVGAIDEAVENARDDLGEGSGVTHATRV